MGHATARFGEQESGEQRQKTHIKSKFVLDLEVTEVALLNSRFLHVKATDAKGCLPEMLPGQFAQLRMDLSKETYLRRPISINNVDRDSNEVWFLVQMVGDGTRSLAALKPGDTLNAMLPLGNGFTIPSDPSERMLLVGGGVGIAPLLFVGKRMVESGLRPTFLLGARTASDLLLTDIFRTLGDVYVTTEDGSGGEKGLVTGHSVLGEIPFKRIAVCGPSPMMKAVARYARSVGAECEVSLENVMACGVGACLCCVEDTQDGHVCVCKEGPVFNIKRLKWQI